VGSVGIKNKGTPDSKPAQEEGEIHSKRPGSEKRPSVAQQELPTQQKPSAGQTGSKPAGQQPEYDYFYYEDLPPEYEYEYVDANGNVYPASALPPQQSSSTKAPSSAVSSTTAKPQQQSQNTRFFNSQESFFPAKSTEKPSAFFFKASQPSLSPSLSAKGQAGQQHSDRRPSSQSGQHGGLSSRPEAVEDFISTKVQQPSKESVAFVSSGKLSGDDSSGIYSKRE
jgi:hypothetical protein